ncbi:MAG: nucleotidyltransferase domain-containing protein [Chitinispirillales bacterium]|jgi:predicted nucleotidyltransferase|nr:nucleotidyltransferase domain-containing protein [Chitinispirillales bacterium]
MKRKPKYTIEEIQEKVVPIAKQYGVERMYLFGSYARGDAKAKSDIDLRIDRGKIKSYFKLLEMHYDIENLFEVKVDLLPTCGFEERFLKKIEEEEVLLYAERA